MNDLKAFFTLILCKDAKYLTFLNGTNLFRDHDGLNLNLTKTNYSLNLNLTKTNYSVQTERMFGLFVWGFNSGFLACKACALLLEPSI
jgi:hypothetical protein